MAPGGGTAGTTGLSGAMTTTDDAAGIEKIRIHLSHGKGKLSRTAEIPYTSGQPMEASFSSLYPGKWEVTAEAYDQRVHGALLQPRGHHRTGEQQYHGITPEDSTGLFGFHL